MMLATTPAPQVPSLSPALPYDKTLDSCQLATVMMHPSRLASRTAVVAGCWFTGPAPYDKQ